MKINYKILLMKLLNLVHLHKKSTKKDVLIFSTFRSGSTWLSELIECQKDFKFVGAPPFAPDKIEYFNKRNKKNNYFIEPKWQYLDLPDQELNSAKEYMYQIKKGQTFQSRRYGNIFSKNHSFITNRTVFRFLRVNVLLDWFINNFDDYFLYLIRHPIPTSLSRLKIWSNNKTKYWGYYIEEFLNSSYYKNKYLTEDLILFIEDVYLDSNDLEKFILSWCLENLPIFLQLENLKNNSNFIMLTYEELVLKSDEMIQYLYDKLELEDLNKMLGQIEKPSTTVKHSDSKTKNKFSKDNYQQNYLIEKWKKEIDKEQEKKIFNIIEKFGIDIYKFDEFLPQEKYFNLKND